MNTSANWQSAYGAALREIDNSELTEKARLAVDAIFTRLRTLPTSEYQERLTMEKAITTLGNLLRDRLGNQA